MTEENLRSDENGDGNGDGNGNGNGTANGNGSSVDIEMEYENSESGLQVIVLVSGFTDCEVTVYLFVCSVWRSCVEG